MNARNDPHVALHNVSKAYGGVFAVKDISLSIDTGQIFCLLGPSGSGKSTLLHMISGLTPVDSGSVVLAGCDVTRVPVQRRNVGVVFQNLALFPHMTVGRNIAYGLEVRGIRGAPVEERVNVLLKLVRLEGKAGRSPRSLSGGEQQRVALARALAFEPSVLLLDEPFSSLDRQLRIELRLELRRIQRVTQVTTVFVTHDQEEALAIADRLAILNHGRLEQVGIPKDLYHTPTSEFVARFLGRSMILPARVDPTMTRVLALGETEDRAIGSRACRVVLRPERVRLSAGEPQGEHVVRGVVADIADEGMGVLYAIQSAFGTLSSYCLSEGGARFRVGESVYASWGPADMHVLP